MAVKEGDVTSREHRKRSELGRMLVKEEAKASVKVIANILGKEESIRTEEEMAILSLSPEAVEDVTKRNQKKAALKERLKEGRRQSHQIQSVSSIPPPDSAGGISLVGDSRFRKGRFSLFKVICFEHDVASLVGNSQLRQVEDPPSVIKEKCKQLADLIKESRCMIVYTGAGISTAASIPDYRGPKGVWTLLQQGKTVRACNLSEAEPTFTHMAIVHMQHQKMISHVVSQNCDGLHLRSGLDRTHLSELHGNMFIEVCKSCKPPCEYIRLFDVTERTSFRRHRTGRQCSSCGQDLVDTIVHFGERSTLPSPINWTGAIDSVKKCDLILCLGSSLKVLRKYTFLWGAERPVQNRPKLCIVNLQWTPKDHQAAIKINGQCDVVMKLITEHLSLEVPAYSREQDPLFRLATPMRAAEASTTTKKEINVFPSAELAEGVVKCEGATGDSTLAPKVELADGELSFQQSRDQTYDEKNCGGAEMRDCRDLVPKLEPAANELDDSTFLDGEAPRRKRGRPRKRGRKGRGGKRVAVSKDSPGWFGKGYNKSMKYNLS